MVLFNYSTRELTAKIVYYGPGLCGKTTNLQYIHGTLPENVKGKMLSLATKTDRTLFFDFLPIDLGEIRGMKTRVQLYTVPGQVFYNETRKLVLKGADGIVFVADSQATMLGANVESFRNLEENLKAHGLTLAEMPHVIQFNKRDLPKLSSIEDLNAGINRFNAPFYESVATTGIGVQDSLKAITKLVLLHLTKKYDPRATAGAVAAAPPPRPTPNVTRNAPPAAAHPERSAGIPLSVDPTTPELLPAQPVARRAEPTNVSMPAFAEQEIRELLDEVEELVDEVEESEIDAPALAAAATEESGDTFGALENEAPAFDESPDFTFGEPDPSSDVAAEPLAAAQEEPSFEIDHDVDPDWSTLAGDTPAPEHTGVQATGHAAEAPPPFEMPDEEDEPQTWDMGSPATDEPDDADLRGVHFAVPDSGNGRGTLTDVVGNDELFDDPALDIARLAAGDEREIIVPVELGEAGKALRRFTLTIRLRLDPVD